MSKFIFVTGGVCSSLGKGVAASSLGALLEGRGLNVCMVKCDPYINVNAGTMSPFVHGEVYVTDDGAETDLDLGNYARFTTGHLSQANSMTTGQIYQAVMEKERAGFYDGRCVQVIPHITDEIKSRIMAADSEDTDVMIVEIGGTVGDIESIPFLEAARQIINERGRAHALSIHLTLIPEIADELKTKPTQHSVKAMQETGIQPDVLVCRAPQVLDADTCAKISLFTNVDVDAVFTSRNIDNTIYEIPLMFFEQKLDQVVLKKLNLPIRHMELEPWYSMMSRYNSRQGTVRIGIVGQYVDLHDAYKSVYEAFFHAGVECGVDVKYEKIDSSDPDSLEKMEATLESVDGVLVPGGFGEQGIDGMIRAAAWARKNKVPYFGICLGMQVMVIEWARNVLGWADADSTEFNRNSKYLVVSDRQAIRLGKGESIAEDGSHIFAAYKEKQIWERYQNSYELSGRYRDQMSESGLKITALSADSLADCIEWPDHPWGLGVQFHPEFKSKPTAAAPLFRDFVNAAKKGIKE